MKISEKSQISRRFLRSIIVSKYIKDFGAPSEVNTKEEIAEWKNKVFTEQLAVLSYELTRQSHPRIDLSKIDPKINFADNQVFAYLVPAILDRMDNEDLKKSSLLISKHLSITDFKPIALEKYFQPYIDMSQETISLTNENKRSLQFFAKPNKSASTQSALLLRGREYNFQHTHIHFEKDGEEKEYIIKDEKGQLIKFDGEVHNVFEYILPKEQDSATPRKRLIAVGSPLQVTASSNPDIQEVIDAVEKSEIAWREKTKIWEAEVIKWENRDDKNHQQKKPAKPLLNLEKTIDFGKVFMKSINTETENNKLIYHSWASLRSGTHGFQSGLRFVISPEPVTVSQEQYDKLKKIFGEMRKDLKEEEILDPIDRKAGWRKERTSLLNSLKETLYSAQAHKMKF